MKISVVRDALLRAWGGSAAEFDAAWSQYAHLFDATGESDGADCPRADGWTTQTAERADGTTAEVVLGAATEVLVPGGDGIRTLAARYALYPEAAVFPSHDPWSFRPVEHYDQALQERDYQTNEAEQHKVIRGAQMFEPRFVANSVPTALDGPPVISADGHVLGGNGRTMMIRRAAELSDAYETFLSRAIEKHGDVFELEGAEVRDRILVRVLDEDVDADSISSALNASWTQTIDAFAGAVSLGRKLPAEVFLLVGEGTIDGTLTEAIHGAGAALVRELQDADIITPQNQTDWLARDNRTGQLRGDRLSPRGTEQLRQAITGAFVGDKQLLAASSARLRDLYERIAPFAMAVDSLGDSAWNVTPAFRLAAREAHRVADLDDSAFSVHYRNGALELGDERVEGLDTPDELFEDPLVAAALLWLRHHARGSRVKGARKWLAYWRAVPEDIRDPAVNMMFGSEMTPELAMRDVLGMKLPGAGEDVRDWLGATRMENPMSSEDTTAKLDPQVQAFVESRRKGAEERRERRKRIAAELRRISTEDPIEMTEEEFRDFVLNHERR